MAENDLDGGDDDQMGQLLAMIRIMQERVGRIDKKLQEKLSRKGVVMVRTKIQSRM